jgi:hypothetical protein
MQEQNRYQQALNILGGYYRSLVAKIAEEIVQNRDCFDGSSSKAEGIIDRHAAHLQNLGRIQADLMGALAVGKPPVQQDGYPVGPDTPLEQGMQVLCDWNGALWTAEIVEIEGDDEIRIHYLGWDNQWDETVPRSRLQLPPSA